MSTVITGLAVRNGRQGRFKKRKKKTMLIVGGAAAISGTIGYLLGKS